MTSLVRYALEAFAEYDKMIGVMRRHWAEWQGEDCLHETAFGGPSFVDKRRTN